MTMLVDVLMSYSYGRDEVRFWTLIKFKNSEGVLSSGMLEDEVIIRHSSVTIEKRGKFRT